MKILAAPDVAHESLGFIAAFPFWVAAAGMFATWAGYFIVRRTFLRDFSVLADTQLSIVNEGKNVVVKECLPTKYKPEALQQRFDHDTDVATSFASGIVLFFSGVLIAADAGLVLLLIALLGAVGSFAIFAVMLGSEPNSHQVKWLFGASYLSVGVFVTNIVLGFVAWAVVKP